MDQSARNKANARHSTGPLTAEGKARSSLNALRHGLNRSDPSAREAYVPEASDLVAYAVTVGVAQSDVDQVIGALAHLRRVRAAKADALAQLERATGQRQSDDRPTLTSALSALTKLDSYERKALSRLAARSRHL